MRRQEFYENFFSAGALFIAGLLIMPSLLFNPVTEYRIYQFVFFLFLALLCGKKINLWFTLFFVITITGVNLLIPYGRVLFSIGSFKITSGALKAGIHRAVTFEALVMISKASIKQDLKLPGSFGKILGESFVIFSSLMNRNLRFTGKNIFTEIDNLLLELSLIDISVPVERAQKTKPAGFLIITAVVLLSWLPVIFQFTGFL